MRYPHYRNQAQKTQAFVHQLSQAWPAEQRPDGPDWDPLDTMSHHIVTVQGLRLDALLHLDQVGLAFTGTSFARLGYDEWLWLTYFATQVPQSTRMTLLLMLSGREAVRRYRAQRDYLTPVVNRRYGFSDEADAQLEAQTPAIVESLRELAKELSWNIKWDLSEPPLKRLAELTNLREQHEFFVTAPSQLMHFSALRLHQHVGAHNGLATYRRKSTEEVDAGFALGWTALHLLKTITSLRSWSSALGETLDEVLPYWDEWANRLVTETTADPFGPPPLIEAVDLVAPET